MYGMRRLAVRGLWIFGGTVRHYYSTISVNKHSLRFMSKNSIRNQSHFASRRELWQPDRRGPKMSSALEDTFTLLTEDRKNELEYEIEVPVVKVPKQECGYYLQLFSKYVGVLHRQPRLRLTTEEKRKTHFYCLVCRRHLLRKPRSRKVGMCPEDENQRMIYLDESLKDAGPILTFSC